MEKTVTGEQRTKADVDRARRMLLKAGIYVGPAVLATALTVQNVYANSNSDSKSRS